MNYLLSPETLPALIAHIKITDSLYFKKTPPKYILAAFRKRGYNYFQTDILPEESKNVFPARKILHNWPTEQEFESWNYWQKKVYVCNENFECVMSKYALTDYIFVCTNKLSKDKKSILSQTVKNVVVTSEEELPIDIMVKMEGVKQEITEDKDCDILHYVGGVQNGEKNYRRFKLNNYLRKYYKVDTVFAGFPELHKKYKIIIISDARGSKEFLKKGIEDGSFIIYDHTDNWGALSLDFKAVQDEIIKKANYVFCSSRFLYNYVKAVRDDVTFIPNGCDKKEYVKAKEKIPRSAVYIGKSALKINFDKIFEILEEGWTVHFYGVQNTSHEYFPTRLFEYENFRLLKCINEVKLHKELAKYSVGLIPLAGNAWTDGMLPLKFFHYTNAHIPTAYINTTEMEPYGTVAFDMNKYSLDEIVSKQISDKDYEDIMDSSDWNPKFLQMKTILKEQFDKCSKAN